MNLFSDQPYSVTVECSAAAHECPEGDPKSPLQTGLQWLTAEATAVRLSIVESQQLMAAYPQWWAMLDELDPLVAPLPKLLQLLAGAPDSYARGLIRGHIEVRCRLAANQTIYQT